MNIVGINEGHNSTACVLQDGVLTAAISEERLTRKKVEYGYPARAIEKCLEITGLRKNEIDRVAISTRHLPPHYMIIKRDTSFSIKDYIREQKEYWRPKIYEEKSVNYLDVFNDRDYRHEFPYDFSGLKDSNNMDDFLQIRISNAARLFNLPKNRISVYDHHSCHAAYGYYGSLFRDRDTLIFTADGGGDGTSGTVSMVKKGKIQTIHRCRNCNLGRMYRYATLILGMKQNEHEYKVMGLAPYARDYVMEDPYNIYAETLQNDGLDFTYKIKPKDHYFYFKERLDGCRFDGIARAIQTRLEELLSGWIKEGIKRTGIGNIAFSGGVAMNVKANKRIGEMDEVEEIFVSPSPGDESTAIGAAYLSAAEDLNESKIQPIRHVYLGPEYSDDEIMASLKVMRAFEKYNIKEGVSPENIARIMAGGGIVARISGRMEFGARALGNRSILANPRDFDTVRIINEMIKGRDFWMPFTPSILKERETDYLINKKRLSAPFMTIAFNTTPLAKKELGGAIHPYDFTARPQLVEKETNPAYWELIKAFEKLTGIGALLNTSFNLHGDPIVASPYDALKTFEESGLEYLLMNNILVKKREKR
ncbi:MAG: carbamoyltransferase C-terminal domain-containing protein [Thermodesulfobacteriota bacterium]|nr:carbamoyltransferase C-terminal domain-containing protein [Thermodesulfobacteriota bacterium]